MTILYVHLEGEKGLKDWTEKIEYSEQQSKDVTILELKLKFLENYNQSHQLDLATAFFDIYTGEDKSKKLEANSVVGSIPDKSDLYAKRDPTKKIKCGHRGCDKEWNESENNETACNFHSGTPVFHEGFSSWSCCTSKKSLSFDQFLLIPTCAIGSHIPAKEEPKKKKPVVEHTGVPVTEVYRSEKSNLPLPNTSTQPTLPKQPPQEIVYVEEQDLEGATIEKGSACKRNSCSHTYSGNSSYETECVYHPGVPIFHEGSKGWSCCKKRTLDFDDFIKFEGCKVGKHKFLPFKTQQNEDTQVKCRFDFYQASTKLTVTIYAKSVDKEQSQIKFSVSNFSVSLKFKDGKSFDKVFELEGQIVPEESRFEILSTKVELSLKKTTATNWTNLERK